MSDPQVQISAQQLTSFVTLGRYLTSQESLSVLESLPHRIVMKIDLLIHVKLLEQCLALDKHYKNVCFDSYFSF